MIDVKCLFFILLQSLVYCILLFTLKRDVKFEAYFGH